MGTVDGLVYSSIIISLFTSYYEMHLTCMIYVVTYDLCGNKLQCSERGQCSKQIPLYNAISSD